MSRSCPASIHHPTSFNEMQTPYLVKRGKFSGQHRWNKRQGLVCRRVSGPSTSSEVKLPCLGLPGHWLCISRGQIGVISPLDNQSPLQVGGMGSQQKGRPGPESSFDEL